MRHPNLSIKFIDLGEIAMGSPYRAGRIAIQGSWIPNLPNVGWQDLHAQSRSARYHALVMWDIVDGDPGFRIVVLDSQKKSVAKSARFRGCCSTLEWGGTGFSFQARNFLSEKELPKLEPLGSSE
jgi:hypothetical protein